MSDPSLPTSRRGRGASGSRADGFSRRSGITTRSRRPASPGRDGPEEEKSNALSTEANAISIGGQDQDQTEDQDQDYESDMTIYHGLDFDDDDDNDDNDDDDDEPPIPTALSQTRVFIPLDQSRSGSVTPAGAAGTSSSSSSSSRSSSSSNKSRSSISGGGSGGIRRRRGDSSSSNGGVRSFVWQWSSAPGCSTEMRPIRPAGFFSKLQERSMYVAFGGEVST